MNINYYRVKYRDIILAERMSLENALIFVKAMFYEHHMEPILYYTIEKMKYEESEEPM